MLFLSVRNLCVLLSMPSSVAVLTHYHVNIEFADARIQFEFEHAVSVYTPYAHTVVFLYRVAVALYVFI